VILNLEKISCRRSVRKATRDHSVSLVDLSVGIRKPTAPDSRVRDRVRDLGRWFFDLPLATEDAIGLISGCWREIPGDGKPWLRLAGTVTVSPVRLAWNDPQRDQVFGGFCGRWEGPSTTTNSWAFAVVRGARKGDRGPVVLFRRDCEPQGLRSCRCCPAMVAGENYPGQMGRVLETSTQFHEAFQLKNRTIKHVKG